MPTERFMLSQNKRTAIRLPRERSVIGILLYAFVLALLTAWPPNALGLLLAATALVIHLLTFDVAFERAHRSTVGALPILLLNAVPYALGVILLGLYPLPELALAASIALAHLASTSVWGHRAIPTILTGTGLLSAHYLLVVPLIAAGVPNGAHFVIWSLYALYNVSAALYVESRLAFRNVSPLVPIIPIGIALVVGAATCPATLLAFVEPAAKCIRNVRGNVKLNRLYDIRRMGLIEVLRGALFITVLGLITTSHTTNC